MPPGAPKGNKNATKNRPWAEAIRRAALQYETTEVGRKEALFKIAWKLIEKALEGDAAAIRELGDRLDGKPSQAIVGDDDGPLKLVIIQHADDRDPE